MTEAGLPGVDVVEAVTGACRSPYSAIPARRWRRALANLDSLCPSAMLPGETNATAA